MIEISYPNVMNGLNKGINMRLVCWNRDHATHLFHRVCDLWHVENFSKASRHSLALVYGPDRLQIQCYALNMVHEQNLRGFRGVYMIHPEIHPDNTNDLEQRTIQEMSLNNERYLEQWRA
ncbi:hypothetical protein HL13_gp33 [Dinoroseobacter phage DFL12phi1]|uniref:Uncharacterized protein n=2 Tax=Baltimorevirus DFL12 TaxID=2169868 RepID=A0A023NHS1_9CAUD|nr:hypothetical protein HL13_gp33 [Dinoroseobacter phage DFL12phi1]AHX00994.1 hypothetical protein DFL12P1_0033 [Dinoroseobacter phage DFL12phi1]AID16866.1 hypothetical protein vBDshPR2C_51 [Dinoroseobacter phage vBDshPR2C]